MESAEGTLTNGEGARLELEDIQSGALHERPTPYVGRYLLLRIDDRAAGRELVRRLHPFVDAGRPSADPARDAWITVAFTYHGLEALGVPQDSLDSFAPEFRQGMAARAAALGDVAESSPARWEKPLGTPDVHVALAALSPDAERLEAVVERARRAYEELPGVDVIWRQDCYQLPSGRTSFGFKDGIGQPAVEGSGIPGSNPRERPIKAGEIILGYPDETGACPRCRLRRCSAGTAPTSSSGSCTRGSPPTGSTSARRLRAARRRRCSAPRWPGAGRAARRSRLPRTRTTPRLAPTRSATTTSATGTICVASSARPAHTRVAPTLAMRSTTREASTFASTE